MGAFDGEELGLGGGAAGGGETAKFAASCGDAMARDDNRDGVPGHGLADFLGGTGLANRVRDFAVSARLAGGDLAGGSVHLAREWLDAVQVQGDAAKILNIPLQMAANFFDDFGNLGWGHSHPA